MKMDFVHWTSGSKCQTTLKEEKQSRWAIWVPWHSNRREFLSCSEGSGKLAGAGSLSNLRTQKWETQYISIIGIPSSQCWRRRGRRDTGNIGNLQEVPWWRIVTLISRYTPWNFPSLCKKSTLIEYISRYYTPVSWLATLFPKQKTLQVIGH